MKLLLALTTTLLALAAAPTARAQSYNLYAPASVRAGSAFPFGWSVTTTLPRYADAIILYDSRGARIGFWSTGGALIGSGTLTAQPVYGSYMTLVYLRTNQFLPYALNPAPMAVVTIWVMR